MTIQNFDFIRSYKDDEMKEIIQKLSEEPEFIRMITFFFPEIPPHIFIKELYKVKSIFDLQKQYVIPFVENVLRVSTTSVNAKGFENISNSNQYFFISNHRDIILDPAIFNVLLVNNGFITTEIAIGDNLLVHTWIEHLVRINKCFIVKRNVKRMKELLLISKELSEYVHHMMNKHYSSVWMAQKEGRAKDGNDKTQVSLLKMLNLGGNGDFIETMSSLNIVPLSISYEYDPCDYLKAREFLLKRDDPNYKKTEKDDIDSMYVGIHGFKGRVSFAIGGTINNKLSKIDNNDNRNIKTNKVAEIIDNTIYANYKLFPINYICYQLRFNDNKFINKYTPENKKYVINYLNTQLLKIKESKNDKEFLMDRFLDLYSNPVVNYYKNK